MAKTRFLHAAASRCTLSQSQRDSGLRGCPSLRLTRTLTVLKFRQDMPLSFRQRLVLGSFGFLPRFQIPAVQCSSLAWARRRWIICSRSAPPSPPSPTPSAPSYPVPSLAPLLNRKEGPFDGMRQATDVHTYVCLITHRSRGLSENCIRESGDARVHGAGPGGLRRTGTDVEGLQWQEELHPEGFSTFRFVQRVSHFMIWSLRG